MSQDIPPVALLISHRVADYGTWKKAFDEHKAARIEASCLGHHINRGADDPNIVYIYCPATDANKVKAFIDSAELRDVMQGAGVQGPPTIKFMTPQQADFISDQELPGIIVSHAVEDYDRWRAAYDDFRDFQKQSGIVGHAVNQELGRPNQVIVYHQANDLGTLRAFLDTAELKEAMQRAGVVGEPDIQIVKGEEFDEY
jgi:hypothetical protein